ncbi:Chitooligosaccharide deacetylase [Rhodovastum atsumiense]|nr:Chitooligosaccharide deacetylase [Rhodovastum atsumiense]
MRSCPLTLAAQREENIEMKRVTLTFDNGPTPGVTEAVLSILERNGLRGTFFMIGEKVSAPGGVALMHEVHRAGHWVANHTLTHSVALGDRPDAGYAVREIDEAQWRIAACATPAKLFRPYGNDGLLGPHLLSRAATAHLLRGRYTTILWNSVPGDWRDPDGWVERCVSQVRAQDWAVVVLHDIETGCLAGLPDLLRRLADEGVTFTQDFPDSVVLTRDGHPVSLDPAFIADAPTSHDITR